MEGLYQQTVSNLSAKPALTACTATAVLGLAWTVNDYYTWKAFGTGGTPPTWRGYLRMTMIRINHILRGPNLLDPTYLSTDGPSYLKDPLPTYAGKRPAIRSHTMPQRQEPEGIEPQTREKLQSLMRKVADSYPELFEVKLSHTEGKSTDGLYAKPDVPTLNPVAKHKLLNHEIAHAHPADNSLHVWLSEPDAKKVLDAGWGQRFPLTFVPKGFTMVYAPHNDEELAVVERIVRAGGEFIVGVPL